MSVNEKLKRRLTEQEIKRLKYFKGISKSILIDYIRFKHDLKEDLNEKQKQAQEKKIKLLKDPKKLFQWYKEKQEQKIKNAKKDLLG